MSMATLLS
ncbi:hypothetical protein LINPERPRIM_LOCUS37044 [Linum perenne]